MRRLYNLCSLPIQVMTTGPLPAPSKCKSGLPRITGTCPGWWKQSFRLPLWSLVLVSSEGHIMPPHIFKVGLKVNTKVYLDVQCSDPLVQLGGWWQTLGVAAGLGAGPQVQRDPGLASGVLRLCILLSLAPSSRSEPDLNPLWTHTSRTSPTMTSHNTKVSLIAAIRRVFAELPPALVEKAWSLFRISIEVVIEAEGGYIE